MLALSFSFPGGRYHATPWGRHVNEADVEWPPSPWRILRAMIAIWHRKSGCHDQSLLRGLMEHLAAEPPCYRVPAAVHTHTRHYMPTREGKTEKNTLVFDAFARMPADAELVVLWPGVELSGHLTDLVDALAAPMGFLGRAESWVEVRRLQSWNGEPNCTPVDSSHVTDGTRNLLSLMTAMPPADYAVFRNAQLEGVRKLGVLKPKEKRSIEATLPESWLDAVSIETADLEAAGWKTPPVCRQVDYLSDADLLQPSGRLRSPTRRLPPATTYRFAVYAKPLPLLEDTVRIGEWVRQAAMSQAKQILGANGVPPLISGHELPKENRHTHAFWLSEDADGDGRLDHLLVHVPAGLDGDARRAVENLHRVWTREGQELHLLLEASGAASDIGSAEDGSALCAEAQTFLSRTPYLMPWHTKRGFGLPEQIERECRARGLPEVRGLEPVRWIEIAGRQLRPLDFHRFRTRRGLVQPDTHGAFLRISFAAPVTGPLALGFGCHFGLGLFEPVRDG